VKSESKSVIHNRFIRFLQRVLPTYGICLPEELLLPKNNFERLLLEAVDEGLSSLGESSRQAIYFHLEKSFNIKKREIPIKIEDFTEAIEQIFDCGADFLEILIMKRLHEKVKGKLELSNSENFAFIEYVTAAKQGFATTKKKDSSICRR